MRRLYLGSSFHSRAMRACCSHLVLAAILWAMPCTRAAVALTNTTELFPFNTTDFELIELSWRNRSSSEVPHSRRKRYISSRDMMALLDYHNRVRSQVFPPAANMEYMVGFVYLLALKVLKYCLTTHYIGDINFKKKSSLFERCGMKGLPNRQSPGPHSAYGITGHHMSWGTQARTCPSPVEGINKLLGKIVG